MLPGRGIKIARILGIDILVHPTWIVIFALVGFSLAETMRDSSISGHPGRFPAGPWPWVFGFATAAIFFACLLAHELSHSFVAKRNGINISRITLFLFGGVAEMSEDVDNPVTEFKMAVAGPVMTFFLAGVFYLLYRILATNPARGPLWLVPLYLLAYINAFVGVFNLLPGFPLDGGRVLRAILWKVTGDLRKATRVASVAGQVIAVAIVGVGLYLIISRGAFIFSGFWLIIIALFLFQLSRISYQQTVYRLTIADTKVQNLMETNVPVVDESTPLTTLRTHYFNTYHLPAFPVVDSQGAVIGLVSRDDLVAVNQSEWDVLNTGRIAKPLTEDQVVDPDDGLDRVMRRAMSADPYLLVLQGKTVVGILTKEELNRYIKARVKSGK
ncbi:MAG: site-2 protease family protein [Candidatus Geothermincolia bacterium]